eukprot:391612-Alexandrium_andersonii.AAC.1
MPPPPSVTDSDERALVSQAARIFAASESHIRPQVVILLPERGLAREYLTFANHYAHLRPGTTAG